LNNINSIEIEFENPNHINDELIHWTGRDKTNDEAFEIISTIISGNELKLGKCPHNFSNLDKRIDSVMTVCFTETPLVHSRDHCDRFGRFGIGFDKLELMKLGANPVLYVVEDRKNFHITLLELYWKLDATKVPFSFRHPFSWLLSSTQPFEDTHNNKRIKYYSQREWRIIRMLPGGGTDAEFKKWGPYNDGFDVNEIRIDAEVDPQRGLERKYFVPFSRNLITSIIVPYDFKDKVEGLKKTYNLHSTKVYLLKN